MSAAIQLTLFCIPRGEGPLGLPGLWLTCRWGRDWEANNTHLFSRKCGGQRSKGHLWAGWFLWGSGGESVPWPSPGSWWHLWSVLEVPCVWMLHSSLCF